eukprot:TRINITY_DN10609_c0_g1_i1.p1 TRINITY_DN10609_c0_g1~~TRINITY_DN10609_c0_g1_i1.p1  ORF type:complete len:274 (+),score=59.85 TRINITY_DN10609_c0_g1_i1:63-884(+)
MSAAAIAHQCRERGKQLFAAGKYDEAAKEYSWGVQHSPSEAILFTNRALCYLKLNLYREAKADCARALEIDPKNVKGHYYGGKAEMGLQEYTAAIRHLSTALDLTRGNPAVKDFHDDVYDTLYIAKKRKWLSEESYRLQQLKQLEALCSELLKKDSAAQRNEPNEVDAELESQLHLLQELFWQETRKLTPSAQREVPEHFCCRISMDIMRDPVVTPGGISYDRKYLAQHLQCVGQFDPVTRETLSMVNVQPNFNLREAIRDYLEENPWAFPGE